jgi:hypothetical protein
MKIQVTIILFVIGIILLFSGVGGIETAETWNITLQFVIQSLLGLTLILGSFRIEKDD